MTTPLCDCKRARHTHGTDTMYKVHRCRCDQCREAATARARARNREHLYGRHHLTDAEPSRQHIRGLMDQGMGWKRVAKAAGLAPSSVYAILWAQDSKSRTRPMRKQINKAMEATLLAVELDLADHMIIDNLGSLRRLRALVAMGWSQKRLAKILGMQPANFGTVIHGRREGITVKTAKRIDEVFTDLWDKTPDATTRFEQAGITRAKREADAKGWVTAAAWDDIDDPDEEPKGDVVDLTVDHRSLPSLEKIDRLELLIRDGYGDTNDTYVRAGWSSRESGWAVLRRMDRTDLVDQLRRNDTARQIAS